MMDMGFIHSLRRVAKLLPSRRQNLFFSATMPKEIAHLAEQFLEDPVTVSVTPAATTVEKISQYSTFVEQKEKQALLHSIVASENIDRRSEEHTSELQSLMRISYAVFCLKKKKKTKTTIKTQRISIQQYDTTKIG